MGGIPYIPRPEFLVETRTVPDDGDPMGPQHQGVIVGTERSVSEVRVGATDGAADAKRSTMPVTKPVLASRQGVLDPSKSCRFCKHFDRAMGQAVLRSSDGSFGGNVAARIVREQKFIDGVDPLVSKDAIADGSVSRPWFDPKLMGLCKDDGETLTPGTATCPRFVPSRGAFVVRMGEKTTALIEKITGRGI